jgi:hypothetical protein
VDGAAIVLAEGTPRSGRATGEERGGIGNGNEPTSTTYVESNGRE